MKLVLLLDLAKAKICRSKIKHVGVCISFCSSYKSVHFAITLC